MSAISQFMKPWKVRAIKALPNNTGVEIEFGTEGREPIRFRTRKFGIAGEAHRVKRFARMP